jgi:Undecaprenyl-phosphate galactose phosphotransferase WbaP
MSTAAIHVRAPVLVRDRCRSRLSTVCYLIGDIVALALAWWIAVGGRRVYGGNFHLTWYARLWPMLPICLVIYSLRGLYPAKGISPIEEFRRITVATSFLYISLIVFTFLEHQAESYSRLVFLMAWFLSVVLVPICRGFFRKIAGSREWWGTPVVLLGVGPTAAVVLRLLRSNPGLGLRVHAAFGNHPGVESLEGVPVLGSLDRAPEAALSVGINTAIVALPDLDDYSLYKAVNTFGKYFPELLIVPDVNGPVNLCMEARSLGNLLTIGVRQNLLMRGPRICKRILDLVLAISGGVLLLPVFIAAAIAIKLSSPGPIFYCQRRIGKNQKPFNAWKFRTMLPNADKILAEYFERAPVLLQEWEGSHKLRNDPRVTRVGRLLRAFSVDELPQLWNVICGEMSLIGPRPIVWDEVPRYAERFELYTRVLPGITGLWQISGRSDVDYQKRVELDAYYVHNWSPWLDVYVLARTFEAVLSRRGAY